MAPTCEDSLSEHLRLSGVSHGYGDRQLFAGVDLAITAGEHVAIVGENGAGKSTLLRILAGFEAPDEGTAVSHGRVGYLAQTHGLPEQFTVRDAIDAALESLRALEAELDRLEDGLAGAEADELERYGNLQTQYQLREGYAAESRVEAALDRLGLGGLDRMRTLGSLSGGEQERVALACVLADPADILLLDEPTNHLDASGTAWLEARLAAHRGTVVVVSHDRVLLRKVASTVIEVDAERRSVNRYGNGYEGYLREKAAERQRWAQQYHGWLDAMAAERLQADTVSGKMGYARQRDGDKMGFDFKAGTWQKAATSKVRNAQERLRRLEASPIDRPPVPLKLATDLRADVAEGPALEAKGVAVPGRLEPTDFRVEAGQKILITGPNGAGKSTLLSVRTSEFHVPVGSLSAGQQRRLALARLLLGGFGTMLVDEPTNHLAPVLVEQLEAALSEFAGTLVMVSHDRALGEWFSTCARRGTSQETRHGNSSGNWLRYAMRDGALA